MKGSQRGLTVLILSGLSCTCLLLLGFGCGEDNPEQPPTTGTVQGQVMELRSGEPVTDATLVLIGPVTIAVQAGPAATDAEGRYQMTNVAPGTYTPVVFHDSLATFDRSCGVLRVTAGEATTCNVRVQDSELWSGGGYSISGVVKDAVTGRAVSHAYVEAVAWAAGDIPAYILGIGLPDWAITDAVGHFSADVFLAVNEEGEELGLLPITVTHEEYLPFTLVGRGGDIGIGVPSLLPIPPAGDSVLAVEIDLRPIPSGGQDPSETGAVRGRVTCLGNPVAGIHVAPSLAYVAEPDTLPVTLSVTTPMPGVGTSSDSHGEFLLPGLTPGHYFIHAGYELGDGYVQWWSDTEAAILGGDTIDVGDIEVLLAMKTASPTNGSTVSDHTPELSWQAVQDTLGYSVVDYELQLAVDSYIAMWAADRIQGTTWKVLADSALAPGAHVKWWVAARAVKAGSQDTVRIADVETFSTFTVQP